MPKLELYGTASCPFTQDMREWLELSGQEFIEFDVERDAETALGSDERADQVIAFGLAG